MDLEEEKGKTAGIKVKDEKVRIAYEDVATAEGKGIANQNKGQATYKTINHNDCHGRLLGSHSPKQRSAKFLIRMFVTFLLRTDPASRKAKPACWKKEFHFSI